MSTLTLRIPDRLKSELSARAKASGKTVPQMVREMLNGQLTGNERSTTASLYDRSRDLCGSVRGGPGDLARNKKHLIAYGRWRRSL
jgi:plasmid stability protein